MSILIGRCDGSWGIIGYLQPTPPLKPGRNDPCSCGSLKKFKACCGRLPAAGAAQAADQPEALLPEVPSAELESLAGLMTNGWFAQLEERARAALARSPQAGILWQLLAVALSKQGKDALQAWAVAVSCLPGDAAAHLNLGNALGRAGRAGDAAASYGRALALQPEFAEGHKSLGELQLDLDQLAEAIASFRRAIQVRPQWADARRSLGKALLRVGHYVEALACCQLAAQLEPDNAEAHNSLGNALCKLGRPSEALSSFRRALALQPDFAEAQANLGNALRSMGRVQEALEAYRLAIRMQPNFVPVYCELATGLRIQRRTAEAETACRQALSLAPDSAAARVVLAELRADEGHFSAAEDLLRGAVAIDPQSVEAWAALPRMRRMTAQDGWWLAAVKGLLQRGVPPQREITLHYAIGKYFDDLAQFEQAFVHFERANELTQRSAPHHDRDRLERTFDLIIEAHDSAWMRQQRPAVASTVRSPQPLFVVGMLRSGTTLAEQILASHPDIAGAGELPWWNHELAQLLDASPIPTAQQLQMPDSALTRVRGDYQRLLAQYCDGAELVVDKMPTNFLSLGLIYSAFPGARIVRMLRNPLDTCLSIYFQHFESANTYTHDLGDLAHYFRQYQRLMDHWKSVLPAEAMLEVPYEGLVAEPEKWIRALLAFVGVSWNPLCLEFHRAARTVVTASKWQVRQPIRGSSVGRWRHYERFLGALMSLSCEER